MTRTMTRTPAALATWALAVMSGGAIALAGCEGAVGGDLPADASPGSFDAATTLDAGTAPPDGGADDSGASPPIDAGEPSADAEAPTDSGPEPIDSGPEPTDAGPPVIDAGPAPPSSTRHTPRPRGTTAASNGYYEYLPPGYGDGTPRPLLVFWHGVGENGDGGPEELRRVLAAGPPRLIENDQWPADRPFIVLSPQHTPPNDCPSASEIHAFIAYALEAYDVDRSRVYLTGLSCGAIGSWSYLGHHLDSQVTAFVGIAGDGRSAWNRAGCNLGRVAIWAFHGSEDRTVSPEGTTTPMTNLLACPSPPRREAKMTIYEGVGHDSWTRTYNGSEGHDVFTWLLGHRAPDGP